MPNIEKLNLWDRFFNRYKKEIIEEGSELWERFTNGPVAPPHKFTRRFVKYKIIDRLTGSETLEKVYLS